MTKTCIRSVRLLWLFVCLLPVSGYAESVYIERPGKEFAATQPQTAMMPTDRQSAWPEMPGHDVSRRYYPDQNRRDQVLQQDNPWRPEGSYFINPQHGMRPWGGVPADAPLDKPDQDKRRSKTPAYPAYPSAYPPVAPAGPGYLPGYGSYGYGWSPYGSGHMPGYGWGGGPYSPYGSYGGFPGFGFPGGLFW